MDTNAILPVLTTAILVLGGLIAALGFRRKEASEAAITAKTNVEAMALVADEHREDMALLRVELIGTREEIVRLRNGVIELEAQLQEARRDP